jgi:enoyl-CoA hydratase
MDMEHRLISKDREVVEFRVDGHVGVLTLNRPEARNAVDPEVTIRLGQALDRVEDDPDLWVAVLTGAPPVFCAGADLKTIQDGRAAELANVHGFAGLTRRRRKKVLIAAVDGAALAGGMELVLACDLVVASSRASFGIPEVKRSLVANGGGLVRLPRKIPANVAMELALTGDPITAERAFEVGLVNLQCDPGAALQRALELAGRVCANPAVAVQRSRAVIDHEIGLDDEALWGLSQRAFDDASSSEDGAEGLAAFIEKRKPNWVGR